jgi:hypothetical protein
LQPTGCSAKSGDDQIRVEFKKGIQHKSALMHSRVWDLEPVFLQLQIIGKEQIQVKRSWRIRCGASST